jgi:hypothetical protein
MEAVKSDSRYEKIILVLILIVATALRFYNLGETSLSNDELSALTRTRFNTFSELINGGVKTDAHPAFVQILIWAVVHLLNDSVLTIRILFALAGVASVYFIFLLGNAWFGKWTGLFSAAALSALAFPLTYSQVARPYSFALLFSLMSAYFWSKTFLQNKALVKHKAFYVLSMAAAMYTHYFSFMLSGIIMLIGLFYLKKGIWKQYVFLNSVVLCLFLPHLKIFFIQLAYGGVGQWLAEPNEGFLYNFIFYCFNNSEVEILFIALLVIVSILFTKQRALTKYHLVSLALFIIPYLVGYIYSVRVNPVLQYSTLIVSFPFLLLFLFSYIKENSPSNKAFLSGALALLLCVTVFTTVGEKNYYGRNNFGVFKEIAEDSRSWSTKYGEVNITKIYTMTNSDYISYYFNKLKYTPQQAFYTNHEKEDLGQIQNIIDTSNSQYLLYAWTNARHYYETIELIQKKYPGVAERDTFFNSEIILFKKNATQDISAFDSTGTFAEPNKLTNIQKEFNIILYKNLSELNFDFNGTVTAEVNVYYEDSLADLTLVIGYENFGENLAWHGIPLKHFFYKPNEWSRALLCAKVPDDKNGILKVYIWNPSRRNFKIGDYRIKIKNTNPLYRPI